MNAELTAWSTYYTITGSSAAALTGLMFIVITLVAGQERVVKNMRDGVETFSSPTVVHFCAALLVSAILAAPWRSLTSPGIMLALVGLCGIVYAARVLFRMAQATAYHAEFDDWLWYALTPMVAYVAILGAAVAVFVYPSLGLYALAGATIALIFMGIRNAWDVVTFIAVEMRSTDKTPE